MFFKFIDHISAKNFVDSSHFYDDESLDVKIINRINDHVIDILENLLEPTKIFFDNLPLNLSKEDIKA